MGGWPVNNQTVEAFLLVLMRVSVVLFILPFFNSRVIPVLLKAGLALLVSLALFPTIEAVTVKFPESIPGIAQLIAAELMLGIILGLMAQIFFEAVRIMGQLVGFQTGFSITNIIDPQNGIQVSILANIAFFIAMVLFLLLNGHHILLKAVRESFQILPPGSISFQHPDIMQRLIDQCGAMFVVAIKIAAPATAALLFVKVAFGLIVKLIPQMNIMIVAFPVQIVVGLFFFGISLNLLLIMLERHLGGLQRMLIHTLRWLAV